MATKPRHLKTATQLWVYDNAKRLNLSDEDLGKATGVEPGTARSWFSRGNPNADAIRILEQMFGRPAPVDEQPAGDQAAVVAAIDRQTAMLERLLTPLLEELRRTRDIPDPSAAAAIQELAQANLSQPHETTEPPSRDDRQEVAPLGFARPDTRRP